MSVVAETQRAPSGQAPARPSRGRRLQLAAMAFLAYGIALIQRPGEAVVDTRLELSVDPTVFLERVFHLWSATTDFGHVQGGQFNGYLFPMAPWFAAGDQLDIPMWILQRLWLGTLLLLAAWGAARLMDALLERPNLVASSGAALLFALNPYVVLFTSRGTVTLLAHAALPWLMLAVHRGLRRPSAWVMPAAIGLILAASGGGVNAAVIAFALLGPIALAGYEVATRRVAVSAVAGFGWRAAVAAAVGSLWWAIPVLLQSRYGIDILIYTEQPSTIWATTSFPELLRSLGFWGLYTGVGFGAREPFMDVGATYLFNPVVIVATFLVPLFAVATFPLVRGWRYAPFFALLAFLALLAMFTGFPREARLREGLLEAYNALPSLQFLRTTYKGMPLLVLALACLGGAGAAALAERARAGLLQVRGRRLPAAALGVLAVIPLLAALPLVTGRAVDREQAYGSVPEWWTEATADAARDGGGRTMVLPGEMFGWYRWGGTMDPVGPGLRREPLAVRELVPYAGPRSAFLQIAIDDLVQQDRLVPGQLAPLLSLTGVRQVLVARDGVRRRNGALDPAATELALAGQPALRAVEEYGAPRPYPPAAGRGVPPATRPEVTRLRAPGDRFGVRVAAGPATVLEGDAEGVTELAAHGLLDPARPLFLAGDVDRAMLAAEARAGATLVLSDSERRRNFIASRTRGNRGPTLTAAEALDPNASTFDAFPERGDRGRTVAVYSGLRRLASPTAPGWSNFPQYRPYAAMDGRLDTSWRADENVDARRWYMELELQRPRPVQAIEVVPQSDRRGRTLSIWVSANGGPERRVRLADGANRVELDNPELRTLRVRIDKIGGNKDTRGAGGITELRIPGLPPTDEHLRLPAALSDAARGLDLDGSPLAVMLQRTTADFPYRAGADSLDPEADHPLAMLDAEEGLEREFDLPAGRRFEVTGWGSVAADAPDAALDRLAGLPAGWRFTSSSRFEGTPGRRASSAFDGDASTGWIGDTVPNEPAWIEWSAPVARTLRSMRLTPGPAGYPFPTRVRLSGPGLEPLERPVGDGGEVALPGPLRTRALRLEVLAARPRGTGGVHDVRAVAIGEVEAAGLQAPAPARSGRFSTGCDGLSVRAAGRRAGLALEGTLRALDSGRALRLRGCGPLDLRAGPVRLSAPPGAVARADHLLLTSAAPRPVARAALAPGRVVSVREGGPPGAVQSARLQLTGPAWVVLEQSWSEGWRATCRERGGGERDLGRSTPIDGYANGWRVSADCAQVDFGFAPQRLALAGYAVSALGCLVLVGILAAALLRRRRRTPQRAEAPEGFLAGLGPDPVRRLPLRRALPLALAIGVVGGALFSLRMGAVMLPLSLVLMLVGVNVRRLALLAAAGLALLPLIYLLFPAEDEGGYNFGFAEYYTRAHYIAVLALCCFAAAAWLAARRVRAALRPSGRG